MMKPITIWERFDEKVNDFKHNHIEDGHMAFALPVPQSSEQEKSWKHARWRKSFGFLKDSKVINKEIVTPNQKDE